MSKNNYLKDINKLELTICKSLNSHGKSKILQKFFTKIFIAFIYGNITSLFFKNLTQKNILELDLPKGKIGFIKNDYKSILNEAKSAIKIKATSINKQFYTNFKKQIKKNYPEFIIIFIKIEKIINIHKLEELIKKAKIDFKKCGKQNDSLHELVITKALEIYCVNNEILPTELDFSKTLNNLVGQNFLEKIAIEIKEIIDDKSNELLKQGRSVIRNFEHDIFIQWKKPINAFESLINLSLEMGEQHSNILFQTINEKNQYKVSALMKLHARAIHMANEILALLKAGYADGANARWRSIHELAVISFFLSKETNELSQRYLDHADVRLLKEAKHYRMYYKKLNYKALDIRTYRKLEKNVEDLDKKYGDNFGNLSNDYNWIPKSLMKTRTFLELEKHVTIDHLHPFYNTSCDNLHGGSLGFLRIGLSDELQDKILLTGPSNYGLSDPLQNTAMSLLHVNVSYLTFQPDFESIINMHILNHFAQDVFTESERIQKLLEEENKIVIQ